ncbi:hypothetical protein ACFL0G_04965 [Candidatus Zixiibacteriota bacterium]
MIGHYCLMTLLITLCIVACGSEERVKHDQLSDQILSIERWPGEGVPVITWTGAETLMNVYESAGDSTPAKSVTVAQNQRLEWDESLIKVRTPGRMEILEDCILEAFVYDSLVQGKLAGGRARQLNFSSGTILEVVCYAAEGYYIFRHLGEYIEMEATHECQRMITLPQTEWWVRVEESGRPAGWIRADNENITVVDRKF